MVWYRAFVSTWYSGLTERMRWWLKLLSWWLRWLVLLLLVLLVRWILRLWLLIWHTWWSCPSIPTLLGWLLWLGTILRKVACLIAIKTSEGFIWLDITFFICYQVLPLMTFPLFWQHPLLISPPSLSLAGAGRQAWKVMSAYSIPPVRTLWRF